MENTYISGNKTGQNCPQCGRDCWFVRYIEQPGGTICLCTCAVCAHYAKTDARNLPQIVLAERPTEIAEISLEDVAF